MQGEWTIDSELDHRSDPELFSVSAAWSKSNHRMLEFKQVLFRGYVIGVYTSYFSVPRGPQEWPSLLSSEAVNRNCEKWLRRWTAWAVQFVQTYLLRIKKSDWSIDQTQFPHSSMDVEDKKAIVPLVEKRHFSRWFSASLDRFRRKFRSHHNIIARKPNAFLLDLLSNPAPSSGQFCVAKKGRLGQSFLKENFHFELLWFCGVGTLKWRGFWWQNKTGCEDHCSPMIWKTLASAVDLDRGLFRDSLCPPPEQIMDSSVQNLYSQNIFWSSPDFWKMRATLFRPAAPADRAESQRNCFLGVD